MSVWMPLKTRFCQSYAKDEDILMVIFMPFTVSEYLKKDARRAGDAGVAPDPRSPNLRGGIGLMRPATAMFAQEHALHAGVVRSLRASRRSNRD